MLRNRKSENNELLLPKNIIQKSIEMTGQDVKWIDVFVTRGYLLNKRKKFSPKSPCESI